MDAIKYPARLANATFYDTCKVAVRSDPEHGCVEIIFTGKDHWTSTRILAFGRGDGVPEIVMLDATMEEEADASETDA